MKPSLGTTTARSRELAWHGRWFGHRLKASVVPDKGATTIRLSQSVRRLAVATTAATVAIGASLAPLVGLAVSELMQMPAPSWSVGVSRDGIQTVAVIAAIMTMPAMIPLGRRMLGWLRRRNDAELSRLAESLVTKAREVLE